MVKIVTDSGSDITPELARELDIAVVDSPITIILSLSSNFETGYSVVNGKNCNR